MLFRSRYVLSSGISLTTTLIGSPYDKRLPGESPAAMSAYRRPSVRFGVECPRRPAFPAGAVTPRGASSMAEQRTFNPLVQGSTPWRPTQTDQAIYEKSAQCWRFRGMRHPTGTGLIVSVSVDPVLSQP